jgi:NO-binding membrane sensor protein with MHYT domain
MLDIFSIPTDSFLIQGNYNSYLVAVSVLIAIFASLMAFQVATQASQSTHAKRKVWSTAAGTFALGGGVWSMHFIGMLAFDLCTKVDYDPVLTSISIIPSLGAAWVALSFLIKGQVDGRRILVSGVLMGAGIGTNARHRQNWHSR